MIITSCTTREKYFWVKIPRTGTHSCKEIFKKYNSDEEGHPHKAYHTLCKIHNMVLPGITVVRHPFTKFISSIHYISERQPHTTSAIKNLWHSTESCINFLNESFYRNCVRKITNMSDLFVDSDSIVALKSYIAFFTTQTELAYHPSVKIFKYENLPEFTSWISETLGYDTTQFPHVNGSRYHKKLNVDFTSRELVETVENLYYDDYKVFNYPLQYLTK
jgi:hypothetical protein